MQTRLKQMLDWLDRNRDRNVIKIITGVRGCGKSGVLQAYKERLLESGAEPGRIFFVDLERAYNIHTPEELMDYIETNVPASGKVYLLLDEICELQEFDVALGTLFAMKRFDIVAVCSTRRPVSERFSEYLSGSFVHINMLPPSFREMPMALNASFERRLENWMTNGCLPYTFKINEKEHDVRVYLSGLWNTILVKDVLTRNRMSDARLAERILERIYSKLGESESLRKISADAKIDGHEAAPNTVLSYIEALDESMLIRRVSKYDVFLEEESKMGYRFYIADIALARNRYGEFPDNQNNAIRNLIYLELAGRGGNVYCGRYDNDEFDFVVLEKNKKPHCYQFAPETVRGKVPLPVLGPLKRMPGDIPKTVITLGGAPAKPAEGINFISLKDFLTGKDSA